MQTTGKPFAIKLQKTLDELGVPTDGRERSAILSKMLHIPRQQAWGLLEGHLQPDNTLLERISAELDVPIQL